MAKDGMESHRSTEGGRDDNVEGRRGRLGREP